MGDKSRTDTIIHMRDSGGLEHVYTPHTHAQTHTLNHSGSILKLGLTALSDLEGTSEIISSPIL